MESQHLTYTLGPGELAEAMALHLPSFRTGARRTRLAFGLFAAAFLLLAPLSPAALIPCALLVVLAVVAPSIVRRQALLTVTRTPAMTEPMMVTFDPDGMEINTQMSRLWYAWANYESVVTSPRGVGLIGRGGTVLRWIPARAFASDDERETWARMAHEGMAAP